jgi:hypothetical protein
MYQLIIQFEKEIGLPNISQACDSIFIKPDEVQMEWSNPYLTLIDQSFVLPGLSSERARLDFIDSDSFDSPRSQKNSLPVINIP